MLLTCTVRSISELLSSKGKAPPKLRLADIPAYIRDQIGLNGLTLSTDLLVGSTPERLASFRDRADKAGCACLMLSEATPQPLADEDEEVGLTSIERLHRVVQAAHLLGCNSASLRIQAPDTDDALDLAADRVREVMTLAEKLEINLLIAPHDGLTAKPERLTDLLKKVGGFRVGTLPDFEQAVASGDPVGYLRRLTPYAAVVLAATFEFGEPEAPADEDKPGSLDELTEMLMSVEAPEHITYDLRPLLEAIASVGFDGTVTIDYRGGGDGTLGVMQSRDALEAALEALAE